MSNSVKSLRSHSSKNEHYSPSIKWRFSRLLLSSTLIPLTLISGQAIADDFSFSNVTVTTDIDLEEGTDSLTLNTVTLNANVNGGTDTTDTVTATGSTINSTTFDLETGINVLTLNNSTMTNAGTTLTLDGSGAGDNQTLTLENGSTFNNGTLVFNVGAGTTGTINIDNSSMTLGGNLAPGNGSLIVNVTNNGTLDLGANNITGGTANDQLTLSGGGMVTAGTVDLTTGDNTVSITRTSQLVGNLTLGTGENTLTFSGTNPKVTGAITLAGTDNIIILNDLNGAQASLNALDFTTVKSLTIDAGTAFDPNGATTTLGSAGENLVFTLQNGAQFDNNLTLAGTGTSGAVTLSGSSTLSGNLTGTNNADTVTVSGASTINGNVNLGAEDDAVSLGGSTVNGNVNLGFGDSGTLQLTNGSSITGTVNAQSATLDIVEIADSSIGGLITLNGASTKNIDLSGSTFTNGFDIDGAGAVTLNSAGDQFDGNLDLSGTSGANAVSLTNSTVNAAITLGTGNDTLTLDNTTVTGGVNAGATDTDNLILSGMGAISSAFTNFENLTMSGTSWTLDNALTLEGGGTANFNAGTFTIAGGNTLTTTNSAATIGANATVILNGNMNAGNAAVTSDGILTFGGGTLTSTGLISLNGTVNTGSGGTITGDGTDGNAVTLTGSITGSDSSAVFTVNDDLTLNTGSTITSALGAAGAASRINVAGAGAVVNDTAGSINVRLVNDGTAAPTDGETFTIINSANGGIVAGNYLISDEFAFFTFDFNASDASNLIATAHKAAYSSASTTSASRKVANALDNGTPSADLAAALNNLRTTSQADNLFNSQAGTVTINSMAGVDVAAGKVTDIVKGRVSRVGGSSVSDLSEDGIVIASSEPVAVKPANSREYWAEAVAGFGQVDSDSSANGGDHRTFGLAFGAEQSFSPTLKAGLFGSISHTASDVDRLSDDADTTVYRAGLYGAKDLSGGWHLNGTISGAYIDYDTSRGTTSGKASADFGGFSLFASAEAAYDIKINYGAMVLSPYVGLDSSIVHHEDYTESGAGALNMSVDSSTTEKLSSEIGVQYSDQTRTENYTFGSVIRLGWSHEFLDQSADQTSQFVSSPTISFNSSGPEIARDSAKIGIALSAKGKSDDYLLYAKYDGEVSADASDHLFSAGVKFKW